MSLFFWIANLTISPSDKDEQPEDGDGDESMSDDDNNDKKETKDPTDLSEYKLDNYDEEDNNTGG